jgi:ParB family chromosome partitioning protein
MDLEWHQLDLRYAAIRRNDKLCERRLTSSIAQDGQQMPIVVVAEGANRFIVIDGFKRIRVLQALSRDNVAAVVSTMSESETIIAERLIRGDAVDSDLEQGWTLCELMARFGISQETLAQRLNKSKSWVSRRIGLALELSNTIQSYVRSGEICAYGAMRYFLPLARTNASAADRLAKKIAPLGLTSRQIGLIYSAWVQGTPAVRERLMEDPWLYLRTITDADAASKGKLSTALELKKDLEIISSVARRARRRISSGAWQSMLLAEREEFRQTFESVHKDYIALAERIRLETSHAEARASHGDSVAA